MLATAGVALLVAVTAATPAASHPAVLAMPKQQQNKATVPRAVPSDADGGVVPQVPLPQLPLPVPPMAVVTPGVGAGTPSAGGGGVVSVSYVGGIPSVVLAAYQDAAQALAQSQPDCHLPIALLAAIGKVESGHARGGQVTANGTATPPILGPVLNGTNGFAAIPDTDGGRLDGDPVWDRAVGPMQFIPSTWRRWASDGNHDGVADPENVYDASLATARYVCANGRDLSTSAGITSAILSYNDSAAYLRLVSAWMTAYQGGITQVADVIAPVAPANGTPGAPGVPVQPVGAPPAGTGPTDPTTTAPGAPPAPPGANPPTGTNPPPGGASPAPPAPPTSPVAPPPPVTTAPPAAPPPAESPVQSVLCGLQDTLGGLGGLLGLGTPPPSSSCDTDSIPTPPTTG